MLMTGCSNGVYTVDDTQSSLDSSSSIVNGGESSYLSITLSSVVSHDEDSLLHSIVEPPIEPTVLLGDTVIYTIPFSNSASNADSVTIIVHESQKMAAMLVDSAQFYRFENCNMYLEDGKTSDNEFIAQFMKPLQQTFRDSFDFVVFVNNIDRRGDCGYRASFKNLKNTVRGTGKYNWNFDYFDYTNSRFEGYIHIPQRDYILRGPMLHEVVHNWANYSIDIGSSSHWGYLGVGGYLGGWDPVTLDTVQEDVYCAGAQPGYQQFSTGGVANNSVKYASLELYLMGLLPADSVPPILKPDSFYYVKVDSVRECFHASSLDTITIDSLIRQHGERKPSFLDSPKEFSLLFVLITEDEPTSEEWDFVVSSADSLVLQEALPRGQNFWSATGGRGHLRRPELMTTIRMY